MSTEWALKRTGLILAVAATAMLPVTKPYASQPHIAPIQSHPYGQTYNEWASRWWRVALETPVPVNPLADQTGENCDQGDMGNVWFLFGHLGTDPVKRECVIPAGRAIFFPVLNQFFGAFLNDPDEQRTEAFARGQVACIKEGAELFVEFDDAEVPDVDNFFEESMATNAPPPVPPNEFGASLERPASLFAVQLPEDNVFGVGEDVVPLLRLDPAVDAGFYLFLFPLRPGRHELHWRASSEACRSMQDVTYHLTIRPGPTR